MKKIIACVIVLFSVFMCVGCSKENNDIIRIHIRANSNSYEDQSIKLDVRDNIIEYITPLISECKNSNDVKNILSSNLDEIKNIADDVLSDNGYNYVSTPKINNEYFPSRDYNGYTFEEGYYDALIINLGSGKGNNWWCVAYPPLCFVGEDVGSDNIEYRSKILEIINNFFGK